VSRHHHAADNSWVDRPTISALVLALLIAAPNVIRADVVIQESTADSCVMRVREATMEDTLQRERYPVLGAPGPNNAWPGSLGPWSGSGPPRSSSRDTLAGRRPVRFHAPVLTRWHWVACDRGCRGASYVLDRGRRDGQGAGFDPWSDEKSPGHPTRAAGVLVILQILQRWLGRYRDGTVHVLANDPLPTARMVDQWAPVAGVSWGRHLGRTRHSGMRPTSAVVNGGRVVGLKGGRDARLDRPAPLQVSEDSDAPVLLGHRYIIELSSRGKP
jgi:hypothetical protein